MLKVASMREDEDQPSLIDTKPVKRLSQKGEVGKGRGKGEGGRTNVADSAVKSTRSTTSGAAATTSAGTSSASTGKPKMRLVNGKLVPVDQPPGLF